jgi:diacylglycerol kinase (ATP)
MNRSIFRSFRVAIHGVLRTIATQRNMKVHMISALLVSIVGMALWLPVSSRVALIFAVALVLFAEILNTSLEAITDLLIVQQHALAKVAKDAAAAGVLVLAVATIVVLADVLYVDWAVVTSSGPAVVRSLSFGIPVAALQAAVLFLPWRRWTALALPVALALLWPLVRHSVDPIFSVLAVGVAVLPTAAVMWHHHDQKQAL